MTGPAERDEHAADGGPAEVDDENARTRGELSLLLLRIILRTILQYNFATVVESYDSLD